jgi:signal transduction histidine kinase
MDLGKVVTDAANVLPRQSVLEIALDIVPEVAEWSVRANRVQLLQVVGNIVLNAYEAIGRSGRSGGTIRVSARGASEGGSAMVQLSIGDDGAGLDAATRARIFQRGFSSKGKAGSGLGLHWTANAIRAMGGSLRVESDGPGRGATVHVLLPSLENRSVAEARHASGRGA